MTFRAPHEQSSAGSVFLVIQGNTFKLGHFSSLLTEENTLIQAASIMEEVLN